VAQEYAKIAFANVADFVSVDEDGRLRIDLEKASQAQQAGIIELRVSTHSKQEQRVILKLGKLQALAALAKQLGGLAAKPKPEESLDDLAEDLAAARRRAWGDERSNGPAQRQTEPPATPEAAQANPTHQAHADEAAQFLSRRMDNGQEADCPPFETRPSGAPRGEAQATRNRWQPPERVPVWPEPGAPVPVPGTPEHNHAMNLLRRGVLNSGEALALAKPGGRSGW
jgi:hypothetical protein